MNMTTPHITARVQRFSFNPFDEKEVKTPVMPENKKPSPEITAETPPPPAPVFSQADIDSARSEARAEGYREGTAATQASYAKEEVAQAEAMHSLLEVISNRITLAAESHSLHLKQQHDVIGKLVIAVAKKLAGEALKREPYANVEALLRECMGLITGEPKITVAVSAAKSEGLRQRIDMLKPILQGFEGEVLVSEDTALGDQDCRVEWKNGYGERNATQIWSDIEAIIAKTSLPMKEAM